jgi:DDE superfamily endonuclease
MWLKRHKNVHFHSTPTHASWLSQIEIWFSILTAQSLNGASFASVKDLTGHIDAFIAAYNQTAKPFLWTVQGPPKTPQTVFRRLMIPGTSPPWFGLHADNFGRLPLEQLSSRSRTTGIEGGAAKRADERFEDTCEPKGLS